MLDNVRGQNWLFGFLILSIIAGSLATIKVFTGDYGIANRVVCVLIMLSLLRAIISKGLPGWLTRQGDLHQDRREYEAAEKYYLKALSLEKAMQRVTGQRIGVALQYSSLGHTYHHQRRIEEAINMFMKAIEISSNLGRHDVSAPAYMSLGKVYFDNGNLQLAEETLNKASMMYHHRHNAQEGISAINQLLNAISERRESANTTERDHIDDQFGFTIKIPKGWVNQKEYNAGFIAGGGRIAVQLPGKANFNLSCGPPDDGTPIDKFQRAKLMQKFLSNSFRSSESPPTTDTSTPISRENNTVRAEIRLKDSIHGMISIIHRGTEYTIQFRTTEGAKREIEGIIASFRLFA